MRCSVPAHVSARHWGTATSTSTTETEPHVSPGYLSTRHWVTFLRRDTELAAVEGRFQVYHPKLPTPSPMLVLDTLLPVIGASRVKHHVTRMDARAIIMKIRVMTQRGQATMMVVHPLLYRSVSHRIVRCKELFQRTAACCQT